MPEIVGVKLIFPLKSSVPPVVASYQSAVSPTPTVTDKVGIVALAQIVWSPPLVGAVMAGHAQFGAVTACVFVQVPSVAVKVTLVPVGIPVTVLATLSTVPAVLVTVPSLVKLMS